MAQVTMLGSEYAELIKDQERLNEVLSYMEAQHTIKVDMEKTYSPYYMGEFSKAEMPGWLRKHLTLRVHASIKELDTEEFKALVRKNAHYYHPDNNELTQYDWNDPIDLLDDQTIKRRWERCQEEIEAEQKEETEDDKA